MIAGEVCAIYTRTSTDRVRDGGGKSPLVIPYFVDPALAESFAWLSSLSSAARSR